ncbi:hypothetical protein Taro_049640 [Colocasia esculenta]|uniref:WW domain-containing protein n=1 Tax=Colocasia esculenta TaxID=4460 RepID=A0A843XBK2_COLES|nr:hypothetical protein [Colocasia esculenta]
MAAPNIDMIAASLRSCSIGGGAAPSAAASPFPARGRGPAGGLGAAAAEAPVEGDITVELNSDVALPYDWEQCLNLKTGQIYYRNRSTGEKSMEDPRKFVYLSEEDEDDDDGDEADDEDDGSESDEGDDSSEDGEDDTGDSDEFGNCSSAFSSSSSASSRDTIEWGGTGRGPGVGAGSVLVAAGCRVCMMYVMIPKKVERCPRCGGHVLHFPLGGGR